MKEVKAKIQNFIAKNRQKKVIFNYKNMLKRSQELVFVCGNTGDANKEERFLEFLIYFSLYKHLTTLPQRNWDYERNGTPERCENIEQVRIGEIFSTRKSPRKKKKEYYIDRGEFIQQVCELIEGIREDQKFYKLIPLLKKPLQKLSIRNEIVVSLSNLEEIGAYKSLRARDMNNIIDGINGAISLMSNEKDLEFPISPIYLLPFWIFISMNLARNEIPSGERSLSEDKSIKYMRGISEQILSVWASKYDESFCNDTTFVEEAGEKEDLESVFFIMEMTNPCGRVLARRDKGIQKYEKIVNRYRKEFGTKGGYIYPAVVNNEENIGAALYNQFFRQLLEEKKRLLPSLELFQKVMDNIRIIRSGDVGSSSEEKEWKINETLNLLAVDLLTGLVGVLDKKLSISCLKLETEDEMDLSKTRWIFLKRWWRLDIEESEWINKMLCCRDIDGVDIGIQSIEGVDPLKGYLVWQTELLDEYFIRRRNEPRLGKEPYTDFDDGIWEDEDKT